jgi:NitT/TauT family transport system substrate-binding protein
MGVPEDLPAKWARATSCLGRSVLALAILAIGLVLGDAPAAAQSTVKFALNWKFEGVATPYVLALDKGYYGAQGLDVSIEQSANSHEAVGRVASGAFDMGVADLGTLIRFRDQNPQAAVRAVFIVHDMPALSIVGRKSRGVSKPSDMEGKKLGAPATDLAFAVWPAFARLNGIDAAKVTVVNVGPPVREPMLASGEIDAFTGISFTSYVNLKDRGVPVDDITIMLMGEYGVKLYGDAVLVNAKFAAEHPDVVKAFLRGFLRGLKETVAKPAPSVEAILRRNEDAKREVELERLRIALSQNILTPNVKAQGIGGVDQARLDGAIEQLAAVQVIKARPKAADIFDPSFLPHLFDRKIE